MRQQLRASQLKPVAVDVSRKLGGSSSKRSGFNLAELFKPRLSAAELALVTRQLAVLIQSNVPIDEALAATAKQARKAKVKSLVLQIRSRVVEGHSLAYALGDFPQVFNEMYRAMVKAAEHAGFLGPVLERLADYTENRQHTQQKLKLAMIYPLFLTLVAIAVVSILMVMVVPQLVSLFAHTNQTLPPLTQGLIATSEFFSQWWWAMIATSIGLVIGVKQWLRNPNQRRVLHQWLLKIPFVSGLLVALDTARFASTLSILTASGVPLLEGLRIAGQVMTNRVLREASETVANTVQEGGSLNRALEQTQHFPPMMVQMVASGEAGGELDAMLTRAAVNQERELESTLGALMSIFTPAMVLLMAVVVCVIVMAILLPIIEMNNLVA